MTERFIASGPNVLDNERPGLICGFVTESVAEEFAEAFNNNSRDSREFIWWNEKEELIEQ